MQRNLFLRAAYFLIHNSYLLFISPHCNYWCVCYENWHFFTFATSRSSWISTAVNILAIILSCSLLPCAEESLWDSSDRCAVPRFLVSSVRLVHLGFCQQNMAVWFSDKKNYIQHLRMLGGLWPYFLFLVGQEEWTNSRHKTPSARTTKGVYRDQPYARYWLYCLMLWNIQSPPVLYTVQSNFFYEQSLFINSKCIKFWMDGLNFKHFVERTTWTERYVKQGTLLFPNCVWKNRWSKK